MENLTNDTPLPKGVLDPPSYGTFSTPLRCHCSVFPVHKSMTEQTRSSFGGVQKFSGERVPWYVFLPPYVFIFPVFLKKEYQKSCPCSKMRMPQKSPELGASAAGCCDVFPCFSETGRIRFQRVRFQTPNSVSFLGLTEFRGANSVSSSQPIICVQTRTHRVFPRTHRVCPKTQ